MARTKFPGVIVGKDMEDRCTLYLKFAGLKTKEKKQKFKLRRHATNGDVEIKFTKETISVKVEVRESNNKATKFDYKKKLLENIDDEKSTWRIFGDERIKIKLVKEQPESWNTQNDYFHMKD